MYKTISLKLKKPTNSKKIILNNAIERYSIAYEILLRKIKPEITKWYESGEKYNKTRFLKLMDKNVFAAASHLGIEPFKDSLKLDLSKTISVFFSKRSNGMKNSYPISRTDDEDINMLISQVSFRNSEIKKYLEKYCSVRPLLFCRHDEKRDYSLICSEGKYFAKLYLYNRKNCINGCRYVIFPLMIPDGFKKYFFENCNLQLKSSELIKKENEFFLNVKVWTKPEKQKECRNFLGIARGINEELVYAVSDESGDILSFSGMSYKDINGINKLHTLSKEIVRIAEEQRCSIILENISYRNDMLDNGSDFLPISVSDYGKLSFFIGYKAEAKGLPSPVSVSPGGIFYMCPRCGTVKKNNRFGKDKFICVSCGYSNSLEYIGAVNLARTLINYKKNKITVKLKQTDNKYIFCVDALKYRFECDISPNAMKMFYHDIESFITDNFSSFDNNQKSVVYKIKECGNSVFKIILK